MSAPAKSFKAVMWAIAARLKLVPETDTDAWTLEFPNLTELLNSAYKLLWEFYPWPDAVEIKAFTPVAHPTVADAVYIPRVTATETMTDVLTVWDGDPRASTSCVPCPVQYVDRADGIYFLRVPASVWVEYRPAVPEFTSTAWVTGTGYEIGDLVYVAGKGRVYRCLEAHTSAADFDTDLAAGKWAVVNVLSCLAEAAKVGVIAASREVDGQTGRSQINFNSMRDLAEAEIRRIRKTSGSSLS